MKIEERVGQISSGKYCSTTLMFHVEHSYHSFKEKGGWKQVQLIEDSNQLIKRSN